MTTSAFRFVAAGICGLLCLGGVARAQGPAKAYLAVDGGLALLPDSSAKDLTGTLPDEVPLVFDPGYRVDVSFGYLLSQGAQVRYKSAFGFLDLAAELQSGLVWNPVRSLGDVNLSEPGAEIDLYRIPVLGNLLFRFPLRDRLDLSLGGGLGALVGIVSADAPDADLSAETAVSFAWQVMTRLNYRFSEHAAAGAFYTLLGAPSTDFEGDVQIRIDNTLTHTLGLQFTWSF